MVFFYGTFLVRLQGVHLDLVCLLKPSRILSPAGGGGTSLGNMQLQNNVKEI